MAADASAPDRSETWRRYYGETGRRPPRPTLLFALGRFDAEPAAAPRMAIDLGCGGGRDTVEILRRGWRVLAIDAEPAAIEALLARPELTPADRRRLETRIGRYDDPAMALPAADLVNASFTLPGTAPDAFEGLWRRLGAALEPGGRLAGQLYGPRDSWAGRYETMTFLARGEVDRLLAPYEVEMFEEEETDSVTPKGERKHWHIFHIVARRRAGADGD